MCNPGLRSLLLPQPSSLFIPNSALSHALLWTAAQTNQESRRAHGQSLGSLTSALSLRLFLFFASKDGAHPRTPFSPSTKASLLFLWHIRQLSFISWSLFRTNTPVQKPSSSHWKRVAKGRRSLHPVSSLLLEESARTRRPLSTLLWPCSPFKICQILQEKAAPASLQSHSQASRDSSPFCYIYYQVPSLQSTYGIPHLFCATQDKPTIASLHLKSNHTSLSC